jgi:hypothetical protein
MYTTDIETAGGQNKCIKCGATDIVLNINNGFLRCNFCRYEFEAERANIQESDLSKLEGVIVGSGALDVVAESSDIFTFECSSCAAEVVIDTIQTTHARCHWCRNTLSLQKQIPNGAVPDLVLPFIIKKEEAENNIKTFVNKRRFFAHPQFKKEFTTENVMGVYLPYMIVDVNVHSKFVGQGEHLFREYTVGSGNNEQTYYDADLYDVEREFDMVIDDLTVESSTDKRDNKKSNKTNNIINSIMPFDTENCVVWNANYLRGFTSEKRDSNIEELKEFVNHQLKDIARHKINDTLKKYNRGVCWNSEHVEVKGELWKAAYLPVWIYSYFQKSKNQLHYIAVNARTKETMGSIPIHIPKLLLFSAIVGVISFFLWLIIAPFFREKDTDGSWLLLTAGFVFYGVIYAFYRNKGARHFHEKETNATIKNVQQKDTFIKRRTKLTNAKMKGANNTAVKGNIF